jgi:hypothetical protein
MSVPRFVGGSDFWIDARRPFLEVCSPGCVLRRSEQKAWRAGY